MRNAYINAIKRRIRAYEVVASKTLGFFNPATKNVKVFQIEGEWVGAPSELDMLKNILREFERIEQKQGIQKKKEKRK